MTDSDTPPRIYPPSLVCCKEVKPSQFVPPKSLSHILLPSESVFIIQKSFCPHPACVLSTLLPDLDCPPSIYPPSTVCFRQRSTSRSLPPKFLSHSLLPRESVFTIQ